MSSRSGHSGTTMLVAASAIPTNSPPHPSIVSDSSVIDGVPHCASCRSEFIEILDAEINPDPRHELPPAPPTRPGRAPSGPPPVPTWYRPDTERPVPGNRPPSHDAQDEQQAEGSGGILGGILNFFGGGGGSGSSSGPTTSSDMPQPPRGSGSQQGASGGGRSWEWSFGNGAVRVQGFSGPVPRNASPFGNPFFPGPNPFVGGYAGAPGNPNQGLDAFFSGFGAPIHPGRTPPGDGPHNPDEPLQGGDLLRALLQIVMEEGAQPIPLGPNGQLGDYVMTDRGYNDILERLMQATGPQGPLPASEETIAGLERFTFDEKTLAASQYQDCPVCMDDFKVGDEAMKIPCGHEFHPDCLKPWLETNGSCPVCRYSLVSEEGQAATSGNEEAGPSDRPEPTNAPPPTDVPTGPLAGITSVLHRLFGQAGTTETPTAPGDIHRPSSQPPPAVPERPSNPEDDPPEPLIDFDTPVRTTPSGGTRRPLPEWARQARGMQAPGERSSAEPRPSPPLPASSGGTSTFGQGGLVPPSHLFDSDVAQFRATRGAGDVAMIPWNSANHQHVGLQYALLGEGSGGDGSQSDGRDAESLLFCHAAGAIGDFSLLQLRRVAGRAETGGAPVREGRVCCHVIAPGVPGEAEMGRVIRECPGAGMRESSTLSFSGERPGSIAPEDVD